MGYWCGAVESAEKGGGGELVCGFPYCYRFHLNWYRSWWWRPPHTSSTVKIVPDSAALITPATACPRTPSVRRSLTGSTCSSCRSRSFIGALEPCQSYTNPEMALTLGVEPRLMVWNDASALAAGNCVCV